MDMIGDIRNKCPCFCDKKDTTSQPFSDMLKFIVESTRENA